MLFRRISHRLALQFTGFVFLLFLVNGAIFLVADFGNSRRLDQDRLSRNAQIVLRESEAIFRGNRPRIPPRLQESVRVLDAENRTLFEGNLLLGQPLPTSEGFSTIAVGDEKFTVLTRRITRGGRFLGTVQVAGVDRTGGTELPIRAILYFLVSVLISGLTFVVGLFFARRSLRPAEESMRRLEQFTQDASHELRTPLAALNSSLDLALRTEKYREGIASAKEDVREITSLVDRLLELARLDTFALDVRKVDLSGLAHDIIEKHRALAEQKRVTLHTEITEHVTVEGDAALLRQVIANLLTNAVKFSKPEGGTVTVRLTKHALSIRDTGIGIAREALPHIFDRFYQAETSRAKEGLGLGLAFVKRIIDLHKWTITVQSTVGQGTEFEVRFSTRVSGRIA